MFNGCSAFNGFNVFNGLLEQQCLMYLMCVVHSLCARNTILKANYGNKTKGGSEAPRARVLGPACTPLPKPNPALFDFRKSPCNTVFSVIGVLTIVIGMTDLLTYPFCFSEH